MLGTLLSGINNSISILDKINTTLGVKRDKKIQAIGLMQRAINLTEAYLIESDRNYVPNSNLSTAWVEAFTAMIPFDSDLAEALRHKSQFWSNPRKWLEEDGSMELIHSLKSLNEKCESILMELR